MTHLLLNAVLLLGLPESLGGGADPSSGLSPEILLSEPSASASKPEEQPRAREETPREAEPREVRSASSDPLQESPGASVPASGESQPPEALEAPPGSGEAGEAPLAPEGNAERNSQAEDASDSGERPGDAEAVRKKPPELRRYQLPVAQDEGAEGDPNGSELSEPEDPDTLPLLHHQLHTALALGMRVATFSSASLDPFSASDTRVAPHLRLGFYPYARGRFSAGVLSDYVYAQTSSTWRGSESELVVHRTGLGLEGRYHLTHRVSLYGRVVAGAAVSRALLSPSGEQAFRADSVDFRLDGAAGFQARVAGPSDGRELDFRLSVFLEGGFDYNVAWDAALLSVAENIFRDQPILVEGIDASAPYVAGGLVLSY